MPSTRVTLKAVNDALAAQSESVRLVKGSHYFYFDCGEAEDWMDKTVAVKTLSSLTLEQWIAEFKRLRKLNKDILADKAETGATASKSAVTKQSRKTR